jgi:hypothetical protein
MRAKRTTYSQKATLDEVGKVNGYENIPSVALSYDFSIVRDDNPHSQAWFKSIMAQA